jgi:hypothetical protein
MEGKMEMVEIVSPPMEEYLVRIRQLSAKYRNDPDSWFELKIDDILDLDDRDEFSFIRMALWDKLLEKEFFPKDISRTQLNLFKECDAAEPGLNPGSTFWSGPWELINTQNSLLAC